MTSSRQPDPPFEPPAAPPAAATVRQVRARSATGRYSRFVSLMKMALPAAAVLLAVLVVLWPQMQKATTDLLSLGFSDLRGPAGQTQRLINPRYHGVDGGNKPFTITADLAEETESGSGAVRLTNPKADMTLDDGAWIMVGARRGLYHQDSTVMDLSGGVDVFHDSGYELHTDAATVNPRQGTASSTTPVAGQGPLGTLAAEGFTYDRAAGRLVFTGRAHLTIRPGASLPEAAAAPSQAQEDTAQ